MAVSVPATSVSPAAPGQQRRTFWRRTAAVLFGLLTALLLAELVLRVAGREILPRRLPLAYQLNTIDLIASGQSQYVYRSDVGWLNRPDFDRTIDDIRYHYNHQGLRADHEYAQKPGAGVKRI